MQVEWAIIGSILGAVSGNAKSWQERRDVPTSRRWVNKRQRHDVSTSQRLNIATLQRRDINAISVSSSLKEKRGPEFEASRCVQTKARKAEQQRRKSVKKTATFVFFFQRITRFYRLNICVLTSSMF